MLADAKAAKAALAVAAVFLALGAQDKVKPSIELAYVLQLAPKRSHWCLQAVAQPSGSVLCDRYSTASTAYDLEYACWLLGE
jgi:hypothetical protein